MTRYRHIQSRGSYIVYRRDYNEFKDLERFNEKVSIERAVKSTREIFHDKGLFDIYDNVEEVLKEDLSIEVTERRRPD